MSELTRSLTNEPVRSSTALISHSWKYEVKGSVLQNAVLDFIASKQRQMLCLLPSWFLTPGIIVGFYLAWHYERKWLGYKGEVSYKGE
jgi:hypothetical protein